jgi:hypothetical protein
MESSITVILKETRGFDRAFQLMYQPCPIWTQNEEWIEDNTKIGFGMKGRFKDLLDYCQNNGHVLSDEKECVVLCRKEMAKNSHNEVQELIRDIANNGYKYTAMEY